MNAVLIARALVGSRSVTSMRKTNATSGTDFGMMNRRRSPSRACRRAAAVVLDRYLGQHLIVISGADGNIEFIVTSALGPVMCR